MPFITLDHETVLSESLLADWKRLALTTGQADPVCCAPNWNLTYREVACPESRLFIRGDDNALVLFREYLGDEPRLYPIESGWMFGKTLLGDAAPELLAECVEDFAREYGRAPIMVVSGVQRRREETARLYRLYSRAYNFYSSDFTVQCSASLEGGLDGWLGRRSANHRAKLRKAAKKIRALGTVFERVRPATPEESRRAYARMLAVEKRGWKGINRCGITVSPSTEFYDALIRRLAREKAAYIIFAVLDGEDIGFIFGGAAGDVYRGQQFSYDDAFRAYSVGNILQLEKVRWLCELGFARYDMGPITGPRMDYKAHWTENREKIETWIMRPNV